MNKSKFDQTIIIACIISTALGISIIIGNGPSLQFYISRIITSTETSIYASSYGQSMASMPDIQDWILQTVFSPLLFCIPLIAIALIKFKNSRDALISTAIAAALSLTTIDIIYPYLYPRSDAPLFIENLVFNFLGALLIAPITLLLLKAALLLSSNKKHRKTSFILGVTTPPTIAILATAIIYLLTSLFYNPVEARLDITLKEPMSFTYTPTTSPQDTNELNDNFGILDGLNDVAGELTVIAPNGALQTKIQAAADSTYRASVTFTSGCLPKDLEKLNKDNKKSIELGEFKTLKITNDSGPLDTILRNLNGKIKFSSESLNDTSIKLENAKNYTVTRFGNSISELEYTSGLPYQSIFFGIPLVSIDKDEKIERALRRVIIEVDNKTYRVALSAKSKMREGKRECLSVDATTLGKYYYQKLDNLDWISGVLIDIYSTPTEKSIFSRKNSSTTIKNIDGWVSIKDINKDEFEKIFTPGYIQDLIVRQGIDTLIINGTTQDIRSTVTLFTSKSSFYAYPIDSKSLRIYGTTKVAFKDQERINKTRWESMDDVSRGAVLSIIGLLALKLISTAYIWIRHNTNLYTPSGDDEPEPDQSAQV